MCILCWNTNLHRSSKLLALEGFLLTFTASLPTCPDRLPTSTPPLLSSAHPPDWTEYLYSRPTRAKPPHSRKFKGRGDLKKNRQQRRFYMGQNSSRKEREKLAALAEFSSCQCKDPRGHWSPHPRAGLPDPLTLSAGLFTGSLNEVIMCEIPHRAFQVTPLPQQCF